MNNPTVLKSGIVDVVFGKNVRVIEPVNLYGCQILDDCTIGPFVEIQRNAKIGSGTKVQSHTFICDLVEIGTNCFIGHGVVFINDLFLEGRPSGGDRTKYRPTYVGNNVSIGSNATILPVRICDGAVIGAGSVVVHDISEVGTYVGNPARKVR